MALIRPRHIAPGATIGIISPASSVKDPAQVDKAVANLEALGFRVKEGRAVRGRHGYLAATAADRQRDLHAMFADRRVDAIMCVRGGYGTMHLLDGMDFALIRRNPKVFVGFSDVTALNLAFLRRASLVSFNGPMAVSTFGKDAPSRFGRDSFLRTVTLPVPAGSVWTGHADRSYRVVRPGAATGRLTGGNLSLVAATIGTPFEIETRGRIVFLEEVDEKPYRVDRMLTQLLLAGKLRDAAAVVFGRNVPDAETLPLEEKQLAGLKPGARVRPPARAQARDFEQTTDDVIAERLAPLGVPVMIGLPFGHIDDYCTLPLGIRAAMDTRTGELEIREAAVR